MVYSGNDPDGWPYVSGGPGSGIDVYPLLELFESGARIVTLDASPWCDVPEAKERLALVRKFYPQVQVLFVIRGANGWGGPLAESIKRWGDVGWFWRRMNDLREQYPLRLPDGKWQPNINIDVRAAAAPLAEVLLDVARHGDGLFLDQWYLSARWFGFDVNDGAWSHSMQEVTRRVRDVRGELLTMFANTGSARPLGCDGQMFENWPHLPERAGGFPPILEHVQPGDVLMLKAGEPWVRGRAPSGPLQTRVRALRGTAGYERCHWGAASSPLKPNGAQWDSLRGHAPWIFKEVER